jgi:hypothetical protein
MTQSSEQFLPLLISYSFIHLLFYGTIVKNITVVEVFGLILCIKNWNAKFHIQS